MGPTCDAVRTRLRYATAALGPVAIIAAAVSVGCASHNRAAGVNSPVAPVETDTRAVPTDLSTPAILPPFYPSSEATPVQLERALEEGKAVRREIEWVEHEESAASGEVSAGEYLVSYLITPSDDYYDLEAAQSDLPAHHTTVLPGSAHVAVIVRDAADGRIVPGLEIRATLRPDGGGRQITATLPYGWHPILNRYGENIVLPTGSFSMSVHIAMPEYSRHDSTNGNRFRGDVTARFEKVSVSTDSLAAAAQHLARGDPREAIDLARREGNAVDGSLADLLQNHGSGSEVRSGDYRVAAIVQSSTGHWEAQAGKLRYVHPDSGAVGSVHLDVTVRDAATGRVVPGLSVRATVLNSRRKEVATYHLPFMWHPWMNHYGLNVPVPGRGAYTIRVRADAPAFRRYGSTALKKFNRPINVQLLGVQFEAGITTVPRRSTTTRHQQRRR
jgi:uncharacterized protein involved in high-affinity Fe2+ transport